MNVETFKDMSAKLSKAQGLLGEITILKSL